MTKKSGKILVVDDNVGIRSALKILLSVYFEEVELLPSPVGLMSKMSSFRPDVVLLDMNFERNINTGNEGLFWLSELKKSFKDTPVVLFTAYADVSLAVEGMKRGAFDFIVKPWENEKLLQVLGDACRKHRNVVDPHTVARQQLGENFMRWGEGAAMSSVRRMVEKVAPTDANVLITGENGTGKDLLAAEIHRMSGRAASPMVCVDLGAVTETLFESELFGHVRGAFTDAKSDHAGKFEQANGGTLFLDEIGNIPLHLQAKLLRVLQNRAVMPVGGSRLVPVDIRLICATNMDLAKMVGEGTFREDLYYRVNTMQIHLPPLRERQDEILPLAEMFLKEFARIYHRRAECFSVKAAEALLQNKWNGNIRELRNMVEKAVIISEGENLTENDLSFSGNRLYQSQTDNAEIVIGDTLDMVEEKAIRAAMRQYDGNLSAVAKSLNISRPTLYNKLRKYNI